MAQATLPLQIGTAAAAAGVRIQTLHYYERLGLIRPRRSPAGTGPGPGGGELPLRRRSVGL